MKKCCKCLIEKNYENFYKDTKKKDGFGYECKDCRKKRYKKENTPENKEKNRLKCLKHYEENKEYYKDYQKEYYEKNRIYFVEKTRLWLKENKEKRLKWVRSWKQKQRELDKAKLLVNADYKKRQMSAHSKVLHAVRKGKLIKPKKCEICNEIKSLQGHHEDYSKPLEVKWVCHICHCKIHNKFVDI